MNTVKRGMLIVFEGIDGTGKSTQIQMLSSFIQQFGIEVVTSFEPTRGEWGMKVRNAAVSGKRLSIEEEIDCLLRDRMEHIKQLIEPSLAAGKWVLLDRYYLSMMAYQGASGVCVDEIQRKNEAFAIIPDVAFLLDIPVDLSLERIGARGNGKDAFENESFLKACADIYTQMDMPWLHRIDATGSKSNVHNQIRKIVSSLCALE